MPKLGTTRLDTNASIRRFSEVDWDFTSQNSESQFSSSHWHPCRFPSQIPAIATGRFSKVGEIILDPFMGSATSLVEAQRLGRRSIGMDINPVACLMAQAKTLRISNSSVKKLADRIKVRVRQDWKALEASPIPPAVQSTKWFMPRTLEGLCKLWTLVQSLEGDSNVIAKATFSAILLACCREDRHWGYVCDNTQPKSYREPDSQLLFEASLERLSAAYQDRGGKDVMRWPEAEVVNLDAVEELRSRASNSVDCLVTSPPYFGVADYVKAQRLSMEWLGYEIEPVRRKEIGARSKRHRRQAAEEYSVELKNVFGEVRRVMKKGAVGLVVFGESPSRAEAQERFSDDLKDLGFSVLLEQPRSIPVTRRQMPSLVRETIFLIRV